MTVEQNIAKLKERLISIKETDAKHRRIEEAKEQEIP